MTADTPHVPTAGDVAEVLTDAAAALQLATTWLACLELEAGGQLTVRTSQDLYRLALTAETCVNAADLLATAPAEVLTGDANPF